MNQSSLSAMDSSKNVYWLCELGLLFLHVKGGKYNFVPLLVLLGKFSKLIYMIYLEQAGM